MNVQEIITTPPRDEYLDDFRYRFKDASPVATIRDLTLKKKINSTEIDYGLFDKDNNLVGYLSLEYAGSDMWTVVLSQLAQAYRGLGYGTFLYDYAIMNDKIKLLSDSTNTGGPHGSISLCARLISNNRYKIVGYDIKTNSVIPNATVDTIYDNKPNTRWLALPPNETINEALERIQNHMKKRYVVWYGPGTTTEEYFNY